MSIVHETVQSLFTELNIDTNHSSFALHKLAATDSKYLKDLKLNVLTVLNKNASLTKKEALLLAICVAANDRSEILAAGLEQLALANEATMEEISEMYALTSLMNTNNIFYRFKHYFQDNTTYNNTPAGLRMNIMMNPVTGKAFFELASLMVSALNNCEMCIKSHEASVKQHGVTEQKIFESVRLAGVIKSLIEVL
ncbi:Alkyl hydroperoxide reductase AhpD [compost metagenome]